MEQSIWQEIGQLYQKFQELGIREAVNYEKYYHDSPLGGWQRQDSAFDDELYTIPGTPPNLAHEVKGDAFAPRNKYALNIDLRIEPPMFKVPGSTTHKVAS